MDYFFFRSLYSFEEDFQKYCYEMLDFLIDDILRTMAMNQKSYFVLNKEECSRMGGSIVILG